MLSSSCRRSLISERGGSEAGVGVEVRVEGEAEAVDGVRAPARPSIAMPQWTACPWAAVT